MSESNKLQNLRRQEKYIATKKQDKEQDFQEKNMATEGDRIFVGKIVVGTDPNQDLTKNDWAIVVGRSL